MNMNRTEALLALNMVGDIGSVRLNKLLSIFGSPENIMRVKQDELSKIFGVGEVIAEKIVAISRRDVEEELSLAKKLNLKIVTIESEEYPANLKNIPGAPIVFYVKGNLIPQDNIALAIVGSRRATLYGLTQAEEFAFGLAEQGFVIVSGLARGIDTYSHRGALKAGKRTIAVIGSGLNCIYPPENLKLADKIANQGAVISEFPLNTKPLPYNFPRRNRLISGLSLGVLVVEASRNSGALITADFALEQGREVFSIPGKVDSINSIGTNELIKQGAKLVTEVSDITEEFSFLSKPQEKRATEVIYSNNKEEDILYGFISSEALQLDELVSISGISIPDISNMLFKLIAKKLVKELPGKYYVRCS